jgi:transketolase
VWNQRLASQVDSLGRTLVDIGTRNRNLVVLDPDVSPSTRTTFFAERFPERYVRIGISEQDIIGVAAGLATSGKIPFVCGFSMFVTGRGWEQITNSVARPRLNVKIVGTHSGLSPHADGESHQCLWDMALMRVLPNMTVVVPADAQETVEAVLALADTKGPAYLRLSRGSTPIVYEEEGDFALGQGRVLREGTDACIVVNGIMVHMALEAADELTKTGISVKVLDMHTVKPLDEDLLVEAAKETGAMVTGEEHSILGGLGSAVAESLSEVYPVPIKKIGVADRFGQSSRQYPELLRAYDLTSGRIKRAVENVVKNRI